MLYLTSVSEPSFRFRSVHSAFVSFIHHGSNDDNQHEDAATFIHMRLCLHLGVLVLLVAQLYIPYQATEDYSRCYSVLLGFHHLDTGCVGLRAVAAPRPVPVEGEDADGSLILATTT